MKCFHGGRSDSEPLAATSELVSRDVVEQAEPVLSPPPGGVMISIAVFLRGLWSNETIIRFAASNVTIIRCVQDCAEVDSQFTCVASAERVETISVRKEDR